MKLLVILIAFLLVTTTSSSATPTLPVVNGETSEEGSAPWMGMIIESGFGIPKYGFHCGATVINKRYLLTAAHCVHTKRKKKGLSNWNIVLGTNSLADRDAPKLELSDIIVHPQYDDNVKALQNDIALLRLKDPVAIEPLPILPFRVEAGLLAKVLGWGQTSSTSGRLPSFLQEVVLPVADDTLCEQLNGEYFVKKTILCAGTLSSAKQSYDGTDACYGDSGGPLVTKVSGQWYQVGIVSSGFDCASHKYFGMYTRLSHYFDWIQNHTSEERELAYLVRDIFNTAKVLSARLSKKAVSPSVVGPQVFQRADKMAALLDEYQANAILTVFSNGREARLAKHAARALAALKHKPNVAKKRFKQVVKLSRVLKRRHRF